MNKSTIDYTSMMEAGVIALCQSSDHLRLTHSSVNTVTAQNSNNYHKDCLKGSMSRSRFSPGISHNMSAFLSPFLYIIKDDLGITRSLWTSKKKGRRDGASSGSVHFKGPWNSRVHWAEKGTAPRAFKFPPTSSLFAHAHRNKLNWGPSSHKLT